MKRLFDVTVAAVLLVCLAPVMAIIAGIVRWSSPGPAIYRGSRVGRNGEPFRILKFRTMEVNRAPGELTVGDDPRVTRIGRLLRATKLDELPQLINVLNGEMSMVGPRPEAPHFVAYYTPEQRAVLDARPGITGPSQLRFRAEERLIVDPDPEQYYISVIMPAKLAIDLEYIRTRSLWSDIVLMARTLQTLAQPDSAQPHDMHLPLAAAHSQPTASRSPQVHEMEA